MDSLSWPGLETISASQLSRRARHLGIWPFLLFFIGLVWQLIRLGAIRGRDLPVLARDRGFLRTAGLVPC
jgi:hypothetical protein